jgi:hypothetical protein
MGMHRKLSDVEEARLFSPGAFLLMAFGVALFAHAAVRGLGGQIQAAPMPFGGPAKGRMVVFSV